MQQRVMGGVAALVVAAALLAGGCQERGPQAVIHTARGPVEVALEVVTTPEAQQQGLMYRSSLADGHGMLFVFDEDQVHSFWMKNTLIPLDLIFITADGRIAGIRADAKPLSLAPLTIGRPARHVLEVPGGFARRRGIADGDRVELRGVFP
jgi:uncharacterized membrane protein (UPF0127 family)